jgi:hypothetical protein
MEGMSDSKGWGDVEVKAPSDEEIREMRLLKWVSEGT